MQSSSQMMLGNKRSKKMRHILRVLAFNTSWCGVTVALRESNAEVLNAEVVFPFQITAWRDAARDRGIDSVQAKQFRAGNFEIISDAIDAARAEGDRRVVALMEKYLCYLKVRLIIVGRMS